MKRRTRAAALFFVGSLALVGCKTTGSTNAVQGPPSSAYDGEWSLLTSSADPSCGKSTAQAMRITNGAISGKFQGNAGLYLIDGVVDGGGNVAMDLDGGLLKFTGKTVNGTMSGAFGGSCRGTWSMKRA